AGPAVAARGHLRAEDRRRDARADREGVRDDLGRRSQPLGRRQAHARHPERRGSRGGGDRGRHRRPVGRGARRRHDATRCLDGRRAGRLLDGPGRDGDRGGRLRQPRTGRCAAVARPCDRGLSAARPRRARPNRGPCRLDARHRGGLDRGRAGGSRGGRVRHDRLGSGARGLDHRPSGAVPLVTATTRPPLADRPLAARVEAVPPSGIGRFLDILATMDDVISLGVGEPDFDTPERIVAAGVRSLHNGRTHYTSNYGTIELRRALAEHLEGRYGVAYDPATELLITVGASEAVDLALRATCDPGDEVVLHEPSYVAYVPAVVFAGGVVRHVATRLEDDFALDPAAVEAAITPRTKALFLGYPCNPTGAVLPDEVQEQLADIARRHALLVYSDEIYDRLAYGSYRHRPFSALPGMRERTILMGGFAKAYAMTGWRVGWLAAPAGILEGIVKVHQYGIMSASTTAQDAALEALLNGEGDVERMVAEYDRRRRLVVDGFNALGLRTFEPRGAFYAFPEVTSATGLSSEDFAQGLLQEERVAGVRGCAVGASGEGHVRACCATSYEQLEEALARIGRFVDRNRQRASS